MGAYTKMQILGKLIKLTGSDEVIAKTLQQHHGGAAVVRNVRNFLYEEAATELFKDCSAVALHWDGSNYHGLIANVAIGVHVRKRIAAHLRPMVPL